MSQANVPGATSIQAAVSSLLVNKVNSVFISYDRKDGRGAKILGKTSGGVTSGFNFTKVGLSADQAGADPFDNVITGQSTNVETSLVDVTEDLLSQVVPGAHWDSAEEVLIGASALFTSEREGNEGIVRLHRAIDENTWSEKDEDTISFPVSFPSFEEAKFLAFMISEQRQLPLVMMCKPITVAELTGVTNDTLTVNGKEIKSLLFVMGTGTGYPPIISQKATLTFPAEFVTGDSISVVLNGVTITQAWDTDQSATMTALVAQVEASLGFPSGASASADGQVLTISDYLLEPTGAFGTRGIETLSSTVTNGGTTVSAELLLAFK